MDLELALAVWLIFSAACYLVVGVRLVAIKREIGSLPIGALFIVISFWVMGGAIELLSSTFTVFTVGRTMHFVGSGLVPVMAYVCFREYTGSETPIRTLLLLLFVPTLSIGLAATNAYHEIMWFLPVSNDAGEFLTRPVRWGPWFLFIHAPYSYAVIGTAISMLIGHSPAVTPAQRRGLFLLIAACSVPLASVVAYDTGLGPNTISQVPIAFAVMLPFYAWLVIGERIIEFTPLPYETVYQNMQDPVVVIDEQRRVIGLNHTAETMLCVSESDALREPLESILGSDSPEVFEVLDSGNPQKMMTMTGRFLHVQVSRIAGNRTAAHGGGQVLMFRDVSDVEKAQSEIRKSDELLRTLIDHSVNGIIRFRWSPAEDGSQSLRCIFANAAAGRFLGIDAEAMADCSAEKIVSLASNGMAPEQSEAIVSTFHTSASGGDSLDIEVQHGQGSDTRWLRLISEPVGDDIAATLIDITDGKAKEQRMESIATSDPLTGVLNRRGFERDATERLSNGSDDDTGALLFIDLNDFKRVNDQFGHEVGDQLLTVASRRLQKSLRSCDIIGRPGGDEFVALVPDVDGGTADKLAHRLTLALEEPYTVGSETLHCAASIGLALYPANANTLTGLLREADQAMYRAKARCRGVAQISGARLLEKAI